MYCSIIWYPTKKTHINQLERPIRFATRTHLRTPYRSDHVQYLTYDQRLIVMELLTLEERRNLHLLTTACKILNNISITSIAPVLQGYINHSARNRNPNIFLYPNSMSNSTLKLMMACANKFSNSIKIIENSPNEIKTIVTNFHLQQRKNSNP